jgi:hypothetical protein
MENMNDYDNEEDFDFCYTQPDEDFDDDVLDWDDESAFTSAGMGMDESYGYAEDAFLDSFYEEQFECENDFGCDW